MSEFHEISWLALIPLLYGLSFALLAYACVRALQSGAESYAAVYTERTARQFAEMFYFIPPRRLLEIAWAAAAVVFLTFFLAAGDFSSVPGLLRGLVAGGLAGGVALTLPGRALAVLKQKRRRDFNEQLVDALMTMSNALRSGSSILQAFEQIVKQNRNPISQEFSLFLQQTRVGVKFEEALGNLERRVDSEDLTIMIRAIEIARQTGGNLTEVFEKIAHTIRERIRIQGRVLALTAQGRLQGVVVGLMPLILGAVMFAIDPRMMGSFAHSPVGLGMIGAILGLEVIGALLIRKIVAIDI